MFRGARGTAGHHIGRSFRKRETRCRSGNTSEPSGNVAVQFERSIPAGGLVRTPCIPLRRAGSILANHRSRRAAEARAKRARSREHSSTRRSRGAVSRRAVVKVNRGSGSVGYSEWSCSAGTFQEHHPSRDTTRSEKVRAIIAVNCAHTSGEAYSARGTGHGAARWRGPRLRGSRFSHAHPRHHQPETADASAGGRGALRESTRNSCCSPPPDRSVRDRPPTCRSCTTSAPRRADLGRRRTPLFQSAAVDDSCCRKIASASWPRSTG